MKYSEYLQFREILEQNNVTVKEFMENPQLYEGVIGNAFKAGAVGLFNLAKKGMKKAVSKGISSSYTNKLDKDAEKIETIVEDEIKAGQEDEKHYIYQLVKQIEEAKEQVNEKDPSKKLRIQNSIKKKGDQKIIKYIDSKVDQWGEKVKKTINNKAGLDEDDKNELLYYWDNAMLTAKLKVGTMVAKSGLIDASQDYEDPRDFFRGFLD